MNDKSSETTDEKNAPNISSSSEMTRNERVERFCTLSIIALISLLFGVDFAIILPTAWGYINTFMRDHYAGFAMGVLLSVFALAGAISGIVLGYLNDTGVSLRRLVLLGVSFLIFGNVLYLIGINIYFLVLSRLIAGVGMGLAPPLLAEISRRSTPQTRTQLLAKILGFRQIGIFLGPCFTIFFKNTNFELFGLPVTMLNMPGLLMAVLWVIIGLLSLFLFFDSPVTINETKIWSNSIIHYSFRTACQHIGTMCKRPVIIALLVTSSIAYFNQTALETTLTPFTNARFHWHEFQISVLFAVAGVELIIVYVCLHFLAKKFSDQAILLAGHVLLLVACLLAVIVIPLSYDNPQKYLPIFLLFVALDVCSLPLIVVSTTSLFTQQTSADQQGIGQGIQRSVINIALVVGPLYAGLLLESTFLMMCLMSGIVLGATALLLFVYRQFQTRSPDELSALIPSDQQSS